MPARALFLLSLLVAPPLAAEPASTDGGFSLLVQGGSTIGMAANPELLLGPVGFHAGASLRYTLATGAFVQARLGFGGIWYSWSAPAPGPSFDAGGADLETMVGARLALPGDIALEAAAGLTLTLAGVWGARNPTGPELLLAPGLVLTFGPEVLISERFYFSLGSGLRVGTLGPMVLSGTEFVPWWFRWLLRTGIRIGL